MRHRLPCALIAFLFLSGCSSYQRQAVVDSVVIPCPMSAPETTCQGEWPEADTDSLRDLLRVNQARKFVWRNCVLAVEAWESIYDFCVKKLD